MPTSNNTSDRGHHSTITHPQTPEILPRPPATNNTLHVHDHRKRKQHPSHNPQPPTQPTWHHVDHCPLLHIQLSSPKIPLGPPGLVDMILNNDRPTKQGIPTSTQMGDRPSLIHPLRQTIRSSTSPINKPLDGLSLPQLRHTLNILPSRPLDPTNKRKDNLTRTREKTQTNHLKPLLPLQLLHKIIPVEIELDD